MTQGLKNYVYDRNLNVCVLLIQGTASEATLVALLGAKAKMVRRVMKEHPEWSESTIISKLVGYASGK
jgi:aromatic-L-amino-acid decarboxylase